MLLLLYPHLSCQGYKVAEMRFPSNASTRHWSDLDLLSCSKFYLHQTMSWTSKNSPSVELRSQSIVSDENSASWIPSKELKANWHTTFFPQTWNDLRTIPVSVTTDTFWVQQAPWRICELHSRTRPAVHRGTGERPWGMGGIGCFYQSLGLSGIICMAVAAIQHVCGCFFIRLESGSNPGESWEV